MDHNYKERGVSFQSVEEYFPKNLSINDRVYRIIVKEVDTEREEFVIHEVYVSTIQSSFAPKNIGIPVAGHPNLSLEPWRLIRCGRGEIDIDEVLEDEYDWEVANE